MKITCGGKILQSRGALFPQFLKVEGNEAPSEIWFKKSKCAQSTLGKGVYNVYKPLINIIRKHLSLHTLVKENC